mgnify:CR=1 FL=1
MTKLETLQLKLTATRVRMGVIEATHGAGCGHPGGSLSAADAFTYLYFREMRIDPEQPQDPNRDRFVLSKATARPACMPRWRSAVSFRSLTCPPCATPTATCRGTPT